MVGRAAQFFERLVVGYRLSRRKSRNPDLGVWNSPNRLSGGPDDAVFSMSKRDLLTSMSINGNLSGILKRYSELVYRENCPARCGYLRRKTSVGNKGGETHS